jgi:O-antigen/teichoic acid export membrane protein
MKGYLYIISTMSFLFGIALILYTDTLRNRFRPLMSIGKTAKRIISFFVLAAGVTLAFAAVDSLNFEFILGSGVVVALAGLVFLINPKRTFNKTAGWFVDTASPRALHLCGILMVIMGEAVWFST